MKKHITIGVAGHVDHGKTSFVKHLTGIETDRSPEEKRRGLSIESGIALWRPLQDVDIALIDVPGHVDFLKNAIRGLNSVDLAILVVAADDGVMPQTVEHLDILRFFGAQGGLVVVSKTDLVDRETCEIARLELQDMLQETFLQGKPILEFSATHPPSDTVCFVEALAKEIKGLRHGPAKVPFRLWIDQVRQLAGIGTVVSGTVLTGTIREGDDLEVLPAAIPARARSLQSHGCKVTAAVSGQRVGINLPKIPLASVSRGMALVHPHTIPGSPLFNAAVQMRPRIQTPLSNGQKIKLYLGTAVIQSTAILMGRRHLRPGESGFVQFRLPHPLHAAPRDAFVVSALNRNTVLGGGIILELTRQKYRAAKHDTIIPLIEALQSQDLPACLDLLLGKNPHHLLTARDLARATGIGIGALEAEINARVNRKELLYFKGQGATSRSNFDRLRKEVLAIVETTLREDPFHKGVSANGIGHGLAVTVAPVLMNAVLNDLVQSGSLETIDGRYRLPTAQAVLDERRAALLDQIVQVIEAAGICPFSSETIRRNCRMAVEKAEVSQALSYLSRQKQVIRLSNGRYLTPSALAKIKERVGRIIADQGAFRLADCKAALGYGRTGAVPVLHYLDHIGFTTRQGNERVLKEATAHGIALL